jgi:hypothetical protein
MKGQTQMQTLDLPTFPPDDVEIEVLIDEEGTFRVAPTKRWVAGGGTVRFRTNGSTAAQVHIPDTSVVFEGDEPGQGPLVFELGLMEEKELKVVDGQTSLPYSVFRLEAGKIEEGTEQAPVIIIVKTSARKD